MTPKNDNLGRVSKFYILTSFLPAKKETEFNYWKAARTSRQPRLSPSSSWKTKSHWPVVNGFIQVGMCYEDLVLPVRAMRSNIL